MLLKRSEGRFFPSRRLFLAFFFDRAEGDLMPSDRAAARSLPSFTATVFFFCDLIFGRYLVKHKRLHQEPTCRNPSKHIFKQHAIWDAIVSDCPFRLRVYNHLTFCLLMSLRYPLNTLSHCISQVGLLTEVGGSGRQPFNN
jgi:hypothetical protein